MAVIINGVSYAGNSVSISGNKILIDGINVTPDAKEITVQVDGNIESIDIDSCNSFLMNGSAGRVRSTNGDIEINGNVRCGAVGGSVKTKNGNIKHL